MHANPWEDHQERGA